MAFSFASAEDAWLHRRYHLIQLFDAMLRAVTSWWEPSVNSLDKHRLTQLSANREPPCLSLYQPTHRHHPDNQQDPIRFGNLVRQLGESLRDTAPDAQVEALLAPFHRLAGDREFWNCSLDGLAVLGDAQVFEVFRLQRPVPELAVVAKSFHLKPLLRIVQSADRYQILALSRHDARLFEGNRDALDEIDPAEAVPGTMVEALGDQLTEPHSTVASYGGIGPGHAPMHHGHGGKESEVDLDAERYFRAVDRAVLEHHSKPSGLPLILAALPEHHHRFHTLSRNPQLMAQSIDVHPDALSSLDELRQRAWQLLEPQYLARLARLVDEFGAARAHARGDHTLDAVAQAVINGRVDKLLIEAQREVPGHIDEQTGAIAFADLAHPEVDDVLDDLGILALQRNAEVVVVPAGRMPTDTGVAAIYRY